MKKSQFIKELYNHIDGMFNSVSDSTKIGSMFSKDSSNDKFTKNDFKCFLKSSYLDNYKEVYDKVFTPKGDDINKETFFNEASNELLKYFEKNNLTKDKIFLESFPYESRTDPAYFKGIATVITDVLEKYGRPPLFHKSQDKVIKHDWEPEILTISEVYQKLEKSKSLKGLFVLAKDDGHDCLKVPMNKIKELDLDKLESDIRKFLKKIDGWWIYMPKKNVMIINY